MCYYELIMDLAQHSNFYGIGVQSREAQIILLLIVWKFIVQDASWKVSADIFSTRHCTIIIVIIMFLYYMLILWFENYRLPAYHRNTVKFLSLG